MHISLTVGAALIAILVVGALALWYYYKPEAGPTGGGTGGQPTTGAVTQADALAALQSELDAATQSIDTGTLENSLLQQK